MSTSEMRDERAKQLKKSSKRGLVNLITHYVPGVNAKDLRGIAKQTLINTVLRLEYPSL